MWEVKDGILRSKRVREISRRNKNLDRASSTSNSVHQLWWKATVRAGQQWCFLPGKYEVQILDNYNNATYPNGQCAAVYKQHIPLVNACKAPGEWQTYDIIFTAPVLIRMG